MNVIYIIGDLSLKHWFNASDKIYNWQSTGIIDAFFLNKACRMLRPYDITEEYDYRFFDNAGQINTLDDFLDDYESLDKKNGLDPKMVADYYYKPQRYVYLEICDILEEMLNTDKYDIHYTKEEKKLFGKAHIKEEMIHLFAFSKPLLRKLNLFKETFAKSDMVHKVLDEGFAKNVATDEEIKQLYDRLKPIVYGQEK